MHSEAEHTAISDWCASPSYWHAPDGWATEDEISELIGALVRATQPEFVLETGAYLGHTAVYIGRALRMNQHGYGHSLEFRPERVEQARRAVAHLPVEIIPCRSQDYMPPEPVGLAFLDSEYEDRMVEVDRYWDHFANWALVCIHDSAHHDPVDIPRMTRGMQHLNLHSPRGLLVYQVVR